MLVWCRMPLVGRLIRIKKDPQAKGYINRILKKQREQERNIWYPKSVGQLKKYDVTGNGYTKEKKGRE